MKNSSKKRIINTSIILIILLAIFTMLIPNITMAINTGDYKPGDLAQADVDKIANLANPVIGTIKVAGVVVLVIVLLILGIKYMTGSASEKAEYKSSMIPYLVGTFILVGLTELIMFIIEIVNDLG